MDRKLPAQRDFFHFCTEKARCFGRFKKYGKNEETGLPAKIDRK